MGAMSPWHWAIIIAIIFVVLFGAGKLPYCPRTGAVVAGSSE